MSYCTISLVLFICLLGVFGNLEIPSNLQGVHIRNLDVIATCWQHIPNATYYEVVTVFPDLSTENFNVSEPAFVLEAVDEDSVGSYSFKVRQWNGMKYSDFSQQLSVLVEEEEVNATKGMEFTVDVNETSTFTWADAPKELTASEPRKDEMASPISCLTFTMETCLRIAEYNEWTTPETLVMDVRILEHFNNVTNRTETVYLKQHTIHYDQVHKEFLGYINVSCQTVSSDYLKFELEDLYKDYNYTFVVQVFLRGRLLGTFDQGLFTGTGYVPPATVKMEEIWYTSGIGVYILTTGALIFMLLTSFVFSLVCGWDRVINDVAVRKDKMRKKKEAEMYEQIRGKLLTESFINDQSQQRE